MKLTAYLFALLCVFSADVNAKPAHAIAMHGSPKYDSNFSHFDYVNPDAPKGGKVSLAGIGSYDSLNPFLAKGNSADGLSLIYDSLTTSSADEAFSQYGLIAKSFELAKDNKSITFYLNTTAKFADGHPIEASDVAFSFKTLMSHGSPIYQSIYADVSDVSVIDQHTIRFSLGDGSNKELPLIIGQISILPEHYWQDKDFANSATITPLGSGPYEVLDYELGRNIQYKRSDNYWAKTHPTRTGMFNYDYIQYDYYRDSGVMLEALKAGSIDFRIENSSKNWATAYDISSVKEGRLIKREISHENPTGMQGFFINSRRALFTEPKVRQALDLAFDFEWTNQALFYGAYKRSNSYFSNSELASQDLPQGRELSILNEYKTLLPSSIFTQAYASPTTDGSGRNRTQLRQAKKLLEEAGFTIKNKKLVNPQGEPAQFEFLLYDPAFERVINPYIKNLQRLGFDASIRMVDVSQYIQRLRQFDFDLIVFTIGQSLSPGNEQLNYWHSSSANKQDSRNIAGINNPVIDALIERIIDAKDRDELVALTRALDRVLLSGHYVIPQWHISAHRLAYWNRFGMPDTTPKYDNNFSTGFHTWWIDAKKDSSLSSVKGK